MTVLFASAIAASVPLIYVALGGLIAERSGVMSISLEGYMLTGAFVAVAFSQNHGIWFATCAAAFFGGTIALLHGYLVIARRINQIISGLAINLLALGLTGYLNSIFFGAGNAGNQVPSFAREAIPGLASLPFVGHILFEQTYLTYLSVAIVALVVILLKFTRAGLTLTAVGENPAAAEARGISVARVRYAAVVASGVLGGVGGAALSIGLLNSFVENLTAGRGYIALAAVVLAGWRPVWAVLACLLFGLASAAHAYVTIQDIHVPVEFLAMTPYVVTLVAVFLFGNKGHAPAQLGMSFVRGQR